jgi:hypothetical protein
VAPTEARLGGEICDQPVDTAKTRSCSRSRRAEQGGSGLRGGRLSDGLEELDPRKTIRPGQPRLAAVGKRLRDRLCLAPKVLHVTELFSVRAGPSATQARNERRNARTSSPPEAVPVGARASTRSIIRHMISPRASADSQGRDAPSCGRAQSREASGPSRCQVCEDTSDEVSARRDLCRLT